jgi:hypothetical protein
VTIDAKPRSVSGVLQLGGMERKFATPFHLAALDVAVKKEGVVKIELPDGKEVVEKFVLDKINPHWVKTFNVENPKSAVLKVTARPWAKVSISGVVSDKETPLSGLSLKEGRYQLKLHFPPEDRWLTQEIQLAGGTQLFCQADFTTIPKLTCR